jgi:hypothetical protein
MNPVKLNPFVFLCDAAVTIYNVLNIFVIKLVTPKDSCKILPFPGGDKFHHQEIEED